MPFLDEYETSQRLARKEETVLQLVIWLVSILYLLLFSGWFYKIVSDHRLWSGRCHSTSLSRVTRPYSTEYRSDMASKSQPLRWSSTSWWSMWSGLIVSIFYCNSFVRKRPAGSWWLEDLFNHGPEFRAFFGEYFLEAVEEWLFVFSRAPGLCLVSIYVA